MTEPTKTMVLLDEYAQETPVKVIVGGQDSATFYLPPGLLKAKCGFFKGCLGGSFQESVSGEVILAEHRVEDFRHFVTWLFTDSLHFDPDTKTLIDLWLFADSLACGDLQNHCMDLIRKTQRRTFFSVPVDMITASLLKTAIENTPTNSVLSDYCMQPAAHDLSRRNSWGAFTASSDWASCDLQIVQRIMYHVIGYAQDRDKVCPAEREGCYWHIHPKEVTDEPCHEMSVSYRTAQGTARKCNPGSKRGVVTATKDDDVEVTKVVSESKGSRNKSSFAYFLRRH